MLHTETDRITHRGESLCARYRDSSPDRFPGSIRSEANQSKMKWLTTNIISMANSEEHAVVWYFHRKDVLGCLREMFL